MGNKLFMKIRISESLQNLLIGFGQYIANQGFVS